nr:pyridoxal-dependent decarboxylase [uncultured Blautia sp.]
MEITNELLGSLREEYGEAFYLLDSKQFRANFKELKEVFSSIYPNFNIAYSYKTNYTPKLCKIVNEMGGYAEVVSEMELELAKKVGVNPVKIIWNGPIKNPGILEEFLLEGGTVNLDSIEEMEYVKEFVGMHPEKKFNIGIRCNFDVKDGVISRFGFDTGSGEFKKVVEFTTNTENVTFINIQCHFAKRQVEYWPARAKGMIDLIDEIGVIPKRIDLGGGLFGKMDDDLKKQFPSEIPCYEDYANAVAYQFKEKFGDMENMPELLIEPGSALVGDCMKFVGTVKTIKKVRGKYLASILGSQKNISMTGVNPPIKVYNLSNDLNEYEHLDMVGFTCIESDVLYRDFNGKLGNGDMVVISNCGSYSLVMKPPFILPNFPVLDISEGTVEVIKRKESFDDIFQTFVF